MSPEQFPISTAALAALPRGHAAKRFVESLAVLSHCQSAGEVKGKSVYAELRQDLARSLEDAYEQAITEPFFRAGSYEEQPEELNEFSYLSSGFGSVAKAIRTAGKLEGKSACADAILALLREWQPLVNAINDLKAKVVSARAPAGEGKDKPAIPVTPFSELVRTAIEKYKPVLEADYSEHIQKLLQNAVAQFGPALDGIEEPTRANSKGEPVENHWRQTYRFELQPVIDRKAGNEAVINGEKLALAATKYADHVAEAMGVKIMSKAGELDSAKIAYIDGMRFKLTGVKNGHSIRIEQSVVLKRSPLGRLFNQFPALVYIDGKFTPEHAYKSMFGGKPVKQTVTHWQAVRYGVQTKACAASAQGTRGFAATTTVPEEVTCERCKKVVEDLRVRGRL